MPLWQLLCLLSDPAAGLVSRPRPLNCIHPDLPSLPTHSLLPSAACLAQAPPSVWITLFLFPTQPSDACRNDLLSEASHDISHRPVPTIHCGLCPITIISPRQGWHHLSLSLANRGSSLSAQKCLPNEWMNECVSEWWAVWIRGGGCGHCGDRRTDGDPHHYAHEEGDRRKCWVPVLTSEVIPPPDTGGCVLHAIA